MRVCVIGGAGFLGSHVADALTREGHQVCIYDRKSSPWLLTQQEMIVGDILDSAGLSKAINGADAVYNFAALADLNTGLDQAIETVRINILGNAQILESCRNFGVKRFIYASTVYVYSRMGGFYRCSKQAAENYVEEYKRVYDLDYTILRYGSLYGPRSGNENGLYRIVKRALETGLIRYQGSADTLREYIHVYDAARASVVALGDDFCNKNVVLTGQEPMRVLDLLEMLSEILGFEQPVEFIDSTLDGHYIRTPYAHIDRVGLKYTLPMHVDLGQGLLDLIQHIKNS